MYYNTKNRAINAYQSKIALSLLTLYKQPFHTAHVTYFTSPHDCSGLHKLEILYEKLTKLNFPTKSWIIPDLSSIPKLKKILYFQNDLKLNLFKIEPKII